MDGDHHVQEGLYQRESTKVGRQITARETFIQEAKAKAASYCAYQERTQQEVRDKLYDLGLHRDEVEETLSELITEDFVNEERFAKSYARGKFTFNKWGRLKILQGLQQKGISSYCQQKGLAEIEESDYQAQVEQLLAKKLDSLSEDDPWVKNNKAARYLIGKGYESDLVWSLLNP